MTEPDPFQRLRGRGFHARRKVFKLFGNEIRVTDADGRLVCWAKQKAFRLREDIRLYADEARTREVLSIRARNVIDFSGTYDVVDSATGRSHGSLRRKGWKSLLRDAWEVWGPDERRIGTSTEDSQALAFLRRTVGGALVPQRFDFELGGRQVGTYRGHFNPFVFKGDYAPTVPPERELDPRLAVATVVLYLCVEGRQE